jgi:hypothetical protein
MSDTAPFERPLPLWRIPGVDYVWFVLAATIAQQRFFFKDGSASGTNRGAPEAAEARCIMRTLVTMRTAETVAPSRVFGERGTCSTVTF